MSLYLRDPTELEDRIMTMLLAGSMDPFPALRRQWDVAKVKRRVRDGWEANSYFQIPITAPLVVPYEQDFADVLIKFAGMEEWRGAILLIKHGVLDNLSIHYGMGRRAPIPEVEALSYYMLLDDPDDPDETVELRTVDRDWGSLLEHFARQKERKNEPPSAHRDPGDEWIDPPAPWQG